MSGNGKLFTSQAGLHVWKPPQYRCAVHGITEHVITSRIPAHDGEWCQLCWIEALDKIGVSRVTRIEEEPI